MEFYQKQFNELFKLLKKTNQQPELISKCVSQENNECAFSSFNSSPSKVDKEHILDVYRNRFDLESKFRPNDNFVIGYKDLIPSLERSKLQFINVTQITSECGTFLIFSDYEYTEFVGILKSKRTLSEVRLKMGNSIYYKEKTFMNGKID
ncbi:hypothetical protein [Aquimarina sp. Aq107]|uniref:hypothetical protein n=1 Tax=Aquimarina sp. Aq107 TaxID=1191912 RepID=UPI000D54F7F9|nr:hypothetical protein [Aquimarina sp. Aq107]